MKAGPHSALLLALALCTVKRERGKTCAPVTVVEVEKSSLGVVEGRGKNL